MTPTVCFCILAMAAQFFSVDYFWEKYFPSFMGLNLIVPPKPQVLCTFPCQFYMDSVEFVDVTFLLYSLVMIIQAEKSTTIYPVSLSLKPLPHTYSSSQTPMDENVDGSDCWDIVVLLQRYEILIKGNVNNVTVNLPLLNHNLENVLQYDHHNVTIFT